MSAGIESKALPRIYLREWRNKRGLSQETLGAILDVDKAQVSNWESGKRRPSSANQAALADALEIELPVIFRCPDCLSADDLLKDAPPDIREKAINIIRVLTGQRDAEKG